MTVVELLKQFIIAEARRWSYKDYVHKKLQEYASDGGYYIRYTNINKVSPRPDPYGDRENGAYWNMHGRVWAEHLNKNNVEHFFKLITEGKNWWHILRPKPETKIIEDESETDYTEERWEARSDDDEDEELESWEEAPKAIFDKTLFVAPKDAMYPDFVVFSNSTAYDVVETFHFPHSN